MKISTNYSSKIKNKLFNFNFFGLSFPIRYKNEIIYHSFIGISLSFILIILIIILSIKYFLDLFKYSKFTVISNQMDLDRNEKINFTSPIMIGICNLSASPKLIEEKYFKIKMYKQSAQAIIKNNSFINFNPNLKNIQLDKCNLLKNYYNMTLFKGFNFEKYLCPKPNQNISIRGRFNDDINGFDIINIVIEKCVNSSENNITCASDDEINNMLKNNFLSIFLIKEITDHYNVLNPIKKLLRTDYFPISLDFKKLYTYNFILSKYYSDSSFIFSNEKKFIFVEIKDYNMDSIENIFPNAEIGIIFTFFENQMIYKRKYTKFYEICSNIGGILNFIFQIFQFITCYLTKKLFISDLIYNIVNVNNSINNKKYIQIKSFNETNKLDKNLNCFENNFDNTKLNLILNKSKTNPLINKIIKINNKKITYFENDIKIYKIQKNQQINDNKKIYDYSICILFIPFFLIKKIKKYNFQNNINQMFKNFMSFENIIPIVEIFPDLLKFFNLKFKFKNENKIFKFNYKIK